MFPNVSKKNEKLDRGRGRRIYPNFSRIFGFFSTWQDPKLVLNVIFGTNDHLSDIVITGQTRSLKLERRVCSICSSGDLGGWGLINPSFSRIFGFFLT